MAKQKSGPKSEVDAEKADLACMFVVLALLHTTHPADTYRLVHAFLAERSHKKVASALKQSVNGIAKIEDGVDYKGPKLQQILKEWKELKAAADAE